jgi:hypothetical protein
MYRERLRRSGSDQARRFRAHRWAIAIGVALVAIGDDDQGALPPPLPNSAQLHDRTGALVLAIRRPDGGFVTNPSPEDAISAGDVLVSVGTAEQLGALAEVATPG